MSVVPDVPQAGSAEPAPPPSVTSLRLPSTGWEVLPSRVATLCLLEAQKLRHDRTELVTRAIQPALWLLIFGQTFSRLRTIPTGRVSYLDFLAPGILAQSALFIAIFGVVVLGAAFFSCLSMTIAGLVLKRDRLMGIGQAITMPLFFASNALYPIQLMPHWPVSYTHLRAHET